RANPQLSKAFTTAGIRIFPALSRANKLLSGISYSASVLGVLVGAVKVATARNTEGKVQAVADIAASAAGFASAPGAAFSAGYALGQLAIEPLSAPVVDWAIGQTIYWQDQPAPPSMGVAEPSDMGAP